MPVPPQVAIAVIHPGVVFTDMLETLRTQRGVASEKLRDNSICVEASADGIWQVRLDIDHDRILCIAHTSGNRTHVNLAGQQCDLNQSIWHIWQVLQGVGLENSGQYWDASKPGEHLEW